MPNNLRKIIENAIEHINQTHAECDNCKETSRSLINNIESPFRISCYSCDKSINSETLKVDQQGRLICGDCSKTQLERDRKIS